MKRLLTLSLLYCPIYLSAQGYQVDVQGQKQQAMGGAGTGLIQDGAAIFYNPGGVSMLQGNSISVGGNAAIANTAFLSATTGVVTATNTAPSYPVTLYAVYGLDSSKSKIVRNFKFGLGIYTPFGASVSWPSTASAANPTGWENGNAISSFSLTSICFQPTVSYKFSDKFGIGAGFVYSTGQLQIDKYVDLSNGVGGTPATNYASSALKGTMNGYGVNVGINYKPTDKLSFGLTYRSQINMKVKSGTANFTNIPASLKDSVPNTNFSTTIPLPTVISFGVGYKLSEKLSLAADINFINFKVFDSTKISFTETTYSLKNISQPNLYSNTFSYHLGGQYMVTEAFAVRLGLRYVVTPESNTYAIGPQGADASRLVYTGGLGYKINDHFTVDASYTFDGFQRIVSANSNSAIINNYYGIYGTYKTYASIFGLSLAYKF